MHLLPTSSRILRWTKKRAHYSHYRPLQYGVLLRVAQDGAQEDALRRVLTAKSRKHLWLLASRLNSFPRRAEILSLRVLLVFFRGPGALPSGATNFNINFAES